MFPLIRIAQAANEQCQLPGVTVVTDGSNDQTGSVQQDIQLVSMAELYQLYENRVYFTLKVASLLPLPQPSSRWAVLFTRTNDGGQTTEWFVAMSTEAPANTTNPAFIYGHTSGTGPTRQLIPDGVADAGSYSLDGTITIAIETPDKTVGHVAFPLLKTGETLTNIQGLTQTSLLGQVVTADATTSASYQVKGNKSCAPPGASPTPATTPSPTPVATLPYWISRLAADPVRPRVYATVESTNEVIMIDTHSFTVFRTIPIGSSPKGLTVSADGSRLWVANSGSTSAAIGVVDLENLISLPSIPAPNRPFDIEEGLSHRLYLTPIDYDYYLNAYIMQINADTGNYEGSLGSFEVGQWGFVETSPDRKTLFFGNRGVCGDATLEKFDISTTSGTLVQQHKDGCGGDDLKIKHDGVTIVYPNASGPSHDETFAIPTSDLSKVDGSFHVGSPGVATFSNDDSLLYHSGANDGAIKIFDTKTFSQVDSIFLGSNPYPSGSQYPGVYDLVVDNSGQWLFVGTAHVDANGESVGELRVYATNRTDPIKPRPTPVPIGSPTPTATASPTMTPSPSPTPTPTSTPPARSQNLATRLKVLNDDNVMIGGFIITGNEPKRVIIRAIGPSVPVQGALTDPMLELHRPDGTTTTNDNWKVRDSTHDSQEDQVRATGLAPSDDRESALSETLSPGSYTAIVRGNNGETGIGLVEVYDLDGGADSQLANIATRGFVQTGNNVMIAGFIVGPKNTANTIVAVRAIGPSLPVNGTIQDPLLELYDENGALSATNDNWQDDMNAAQVQANSLDPKDFRESAVLRSLAPGAYTAIVRGKNNATGVGLVEVYNLR